ncbi:MAG: DUF2752 domain-containing protein [Acidimicrobiales bacterium]
MAAPVSASPPTAPDPVGTGRAPWWTRLWVRPAAVGGAVLAATAYVTVLDPNTSHAFPLCPLRVATGIDCPGCGALRATFSLSRGDVLQAADHNLLFVAAVPLALLAYGVWLAGSLGLRVPRWRVPRQSLAVIAVVAVAFMVVRNLPVEALSFLDSTAD